MKTQHTHQSHLIKLLLMCLTILLFPAQSHARDGSFSWAANPDPLVGYKLYYKTGNDKEAPFNGTGLNEGDSPIIVGKITTYTVTGMSPNETYHFTLTAYNDTEESGFSDTVTFTPIAFTSPTITSMSQN